MAFNYKSTLFASLQLLFSFSSSFARPTIPHSQVLLIFFDGDLNIIVIIPIETYRSVCVCVYVDGEI
jgi:hypothetical protein